MKQRLHTQNIPPKLRTILCSGILLGLLGVGITNKISANEPTTRIQVEDLSFPAAIQMAKYRLEARSTAHFTFFGMDILAAVLYLNGPNQPKDVLKDIPKRLAFCYFRNFTAEEFVEQTRELMEKNNAPSVFSKIRGEIDSFNRLYQNVKKGDCYSLTYLPGLGTTLRLNNKKLGTIKGAAFAKALFRVWFGPKPFQQDLKDQLLEPIKKAPPKP